MNTSMIHTDKNISDLVYKILEEQVAEYNWRFYFLIEHAL